MLPYAKIGITNFVIPILGFEFDFRISFYKSNKPYLINLVRITSALSPTIASQEYHLQ